MKLCVVQESQSIRIDLGHAGVHMQEPEGRVRIDGSCQRERMGADPHCLTRAAQNGGGGGALHASLLPCMAILSHTAELHTNSLLVPKSEPDC